MLFWGYLPLYQNQEQLKHFFLPRSTTAAVWRSPSPSSPFIISLSTQLCVDQIHHDCRAVLRPYWGLSTGFIFAWLASGLRTHWSHSPLGKEMCTIVPLCLPMPLPWAHATWQGTQTQPPACPVCFLCSKTLSGIAEDDVHCGKLWQLYTTFNIQGVPPISLPPPVVRVNARLTYAVRSSSK